MGTTVKNLELTWQDTVDGSDLEEITDMANGFPFEKQREQRLSLDRETIGSDVYSTNHDRRRYLLAYFGDDLVGSIALTEFPDNRLIGEHELIQRNRDDIRGQLFHAIADQYPDHQLLIQYPAQNRTARQFIKTHPSIAIQNQSQSLHLLGAPQSDNNPILNLINNNDDNVLDETLSHFPDKQSVFDWGPLDKLWPIEKETVTKDESNLEIAILSRHLNTRNEDTSRQILAVKSTGEAEKGELGKALNRWIQSQSIDHPEWTGSAYEEEALKSNADLDIINKRVSFKIVLSN